MPHRDRFGGLRSGFAALAVLLTLLPTVAIAATLFPEPLHLTRVVDDPISGKSVTIDEYYHGNRVISITGERTVIADYAKNEVIEIDRAESTYSVTPFDEIAKTAPKRMARRNASSNSDEQWTIAALKRSSGKANTEFFSATPKERGDIRRVEVGVDHTVRLSRDALEVVLGAAYPHEQNEQTEVVVRATREGGLPALRTNSASSESHALPVEQTITYEMDGRELVSRNRVTRVGTELPLPALLSIPPGARQVETRRAQTAKALEELERPVTTSTTPPQR